MRKILFWAIFFALPTAASAQQTKVKIVVENRGGTFPSLLVMDAGRGKGIVKEWQVNSCRFEEPLSIKLPANTVLAEIEPGERRFHVTNARLSFPQSVIYRVEKSDGTVLLKTEQTVDPRTFDLKAGDRLVVTIYRPYEAYNHKFFTVQGVPMAIGMPRPYWYQDIQKEWKGDEKFPNTLFFMVHKDWGPEKVFEQLAEEVVAKMHDPNYTPGDYRKNHMSCLVALSPDGKIPESLLKIKKEDLQKELKAAMLKAWDALVAEKCYRTFPADQVAALKQAGYLPRGYPDGSADISIRVGLQHAKNITLPKWLGD